MEYTYEFFEKSARYVREKLDFQPEIGIILGSSLGPFAAQVENPVVIPYEDIPNFLRYPRREADLRHHRRQEGGVHVRAVPLLRGV